jgi:hypothetical protein
MIRPFTFLCFCAFAAAGAWLYQVKHAVAMKDRELLEIQRQTEAARQRIDILRAEWALLNEPDRLRQTATRVLTLEPMQPQHFVRPNDLERRLPGAVAFAGAPDLFGPAQRAGVMLASARSPAPAPAAAAMPQPAATQPAMTAGPQPATAQPASVAPVAAGAAAAALAEAAARVPETPAPRALAATIAAQRAEQAVRPAPRPAPPRPIQPAVLVTPAPAMPAPPVTRVTRAAPTETTVASALGGVISPGRPMLAPPVPIAPAAAATLR